MRGATLELLDITYDGEEDSVTGVLSGGLGQLVIIIIIIIIIIINIIIPGTPPPLNQTDNSNPYLLIILNVNHNNYSIRREPWKTSLKLVT